MTTPRASMTAACLAAALCFAALARAEAPAPAAKGETVIASATVTATVVKVDPETREVTLRSEDGKEVSFVAGEEVKNLAQMKPGDVVTATYAEALAYEVMKGGETVAPASVVGGAAAVPGERPAAGIARQTTATVMITEIDRNAPSVTFKGPQGNVRTIKVMHPEKLEGVSVGDTVQLTFTEAFGIKVEPAPQK
jgi:Cu/Ag efflux protein CusF